MFQWKIHLHDIRSSIERFTEKAKNDTSFLHYASAHIQTINEQKVKLLKLFDSFDTPNSEETIEEYVDFCILNDIPYLFIILEISNISREILGLLTSGGKSSASANSHFEYLESKISEGYYHQFLRKLAAKQHLRLSHLSNLIEKHLMIHYQHHLEWMLVVIAKVEGTARKDSYCELNHSLCSFGTWLHNPTIPYLSSTSHFKDIQKLHIALHELASDLMTQYTANKLDYQNMIQLLQRLDYTSLEIGSEIAILNDMMIIGEYAKDPLTGLLGRRLLDKIVMGQIDIAKATESECALFMCDLDHFKEINDRYGHLGGDEVIKNFSTLLQSNLRKSDFIFRFGGEEFLIILPSTSYQEALALAEKICKISAMEKISYEEKIISYSVSIGVSAIEMDTLSFVTKETIQKYIRIVDSKLYLAKQNGRNRVE